MSRERSSTVENASCMKCSIVIRSYNEAEHIGRLLLGIGQQTMPPDEVIVVDSGSTDGTPDIARSHGAQVVEIDKREFSFGRALNIGFSRAGGDIVISVGRECLIGANAGLGIPLGDRCTIEAGLFVTAGTKVSVLDDGGDTIETVSARTLAGRSDLLFRRHSSTGAVQCLTNKSAIELNEMLHANN